VCFSAPAIALRRQPRQPASKVVELPVASPGFYVRVRWACEVQFYDGESPHTTQRAKKQRMRKSKRRQTYLTVVRNYPRDDWGRFQADKTRTNFHGGPRDLRPIGRFVNQFLSVLPLSILPRVVRCGVGEAEHVPRHALTKNIPGYAVHRPGSRSRRNAFPSHTCQIGLDRATKAFASNALMVRFAQFGGASQPSFLFPQRPNE
jgi:hypothetical protein